MDLARLRMLVELGRLADAESGLRTLLASEPGNAAAMLLLAEVLGDLDRPAEALDAAERAVALQPGSAMAHRRLAHALAATKRYDEAVAAAGESVRLAPQSWASHYTLGMMLRLGRRPRTRDALASANQAVSLAPHSPDAHNLAGMCLDDLGMPDEAMRAYTEALRLNPQHALVLNNIAALQAGHGRLRGAATYVSAGLSSDAQHKVLHRNYDVILVKLMRRLYLVALGFAVLIGLLLAARVPYLFRLAVGLVMVAVFVLTTRHILAALPRGADRHALGLLRRSRGGVRVAILVFLGTGVAVLAMALAPRDVSAAVGIWLLVSMRFVAIGLIVAGFARGAVGLFRRRPQGRASRRGP